ncbi:MAG: flavin-containing monooxygenase [Nocardioidaceae bacterium]
MNTSNERFETVVIGGGQAGLSVGYHLARQGRQFVILDEQARVGDGWRRNWDTLRLYSPAVKDGLPGMPFPASMWTYPTKDQMGDYLEEYAARFELPVRSSVRVEELSANGDGYVVTTDTGCIEADNVVVATGTFGRAPNIPDFARDLGPGILQMHSSEYRRPSQLIPGGVLVVGASHSGADVAFDVGTHQPTVLSGPIHGEAPFRIEGRVAHVVLPVLFFAVSHILTIRTPLGRKIRPEIRQHGGPLLRVKKQDLANAGVEWEKSKVVGVQDGLPVLDGGRVLDVANVVWCTGFRQDYGWIKLPVTGEDGWPKESRGVVTAQPGLYFTGLAFQFGFTSMLVAGAGRDAKYVVDHLVSRSAVRAGRRGNRLERAS